MDTKKPGHTYTRDTTHTRAVGEGLRRICALLGLACIALIFGAAVGLVMWMVAK